MGTTKFSIVTITCNHRRGLARSFASIQSQTYADYEWIIIDGDSTDGTKDDFMQYNHAKIISEKDNGIYDAMNKGVDRATGDYILFLNAGDILADELVLEKISAAAKNKPDFIYGDALEGGHYKPARSHIKIHWGMFTHHQAMLYRRDILRDMRFNTTYKIAADYDLTVRFLEKCKNIVYVPMAICDFEVGGASQLNAKLGRDEQFYIRQSLKTCPAYYNYLIRLAQYLRFTLRTYFPKVYWLLKMVL